MAKKKADPVPEPPLRLVYMDPGELAENPQNWRTHPTSQVSALTDAIAEVGWAGACLFNERTGRLIDGHARKKVAIEQGAKAVPVLVGNWTEEQEKKILATLDPLAAMASADAGKLEALLREVSTGSEALVAMLTELAQKSGVIPADGKPTASGGERDPDEPMEEGEDPGEEPEDSLDIIFKAPYPWFGGKSRVAKKVWDRFGNVASYIEPFYGSGAVMLNRPQPFHGVETINDFDGLVANFWRAVKSDPDRVAGYADWPVNENDLHARHAWLVSQKNSLQSRLEGDPEWFDLKIAGWWVWGMACWIGSGFCSGEGPWQIEEAEDGSRQLVHLGDAGQGVNRKLVHLGDAGQGVNRQRVHLGDAGQGVNRQRVHLGDAGRGETASESNPGIGERGLLEWMRALSARLQRVRVCCGDWTRVCGGQTGNALQHFFAAGQPCGIFLDPPYADTAARVAGLYRQDSLSVAHAVREWAIAHGDDPRLRIALCGYEGEHVMPDNWEVVAWKTAGGYASQASGDTDVTGVANSYRERLWFSPHCLKTEKVS